MDIEMSSMKRIKVLNTPNQSTCTERIETGLIRLVAWSLASLFSTNTAISETRLDLFNELIPTQHHGNAPTHCIAGFSQLQSLPLI